MKLAHWTARTLVVVFALVCSSKAHAVVLIDNFGPPVQSIDILTTRVLVDPGNLNDTSDVGADVSNTYDPTSGATAVATHYAYADFATRTGQVLSTAGAGTLPFDQRDVQLVGTTGTSLYSAGGLSLVSNQGGSADLLLQYDGVDTLATYTDFNPLNNGQLLGGSVGVGIDLVQVVNNGFYFTNVYGNGIIDVTMRVWTVTGGNTYQQATYQVNLNSPVDTVDGGGNITPTSFAVLYNTFTLGGAGFNQVTGINILFHLDQDEDITIGYNGEGGIFATTPEPATLAMWSLLGMSGMGLGYFRRRKLAA